MKPKMEEEEEEEVFEEEEEPQDDKDDVKDFEDPGDLDPGDLDFDEEPSMAVPGKRFVLYYDFWIFLYFCIIEAE